MSELLEKCTLAKDAGYKMVSVSTVTKDNALEAIANALVERADEIIAANNIDIENAKKNGTRQAMIDRLTLTKERIDGIAEGVRQVKALADPIGEVIKMWKRPNGLTIGQKRVPMGVIAIIYEARPNVTVDAAVLCLKTSNACILRGGSEAINSNKAVMKIMQDAAYGVGIPEGTLNIIKDTSRETATQLMKMNGYVDLLIPRGGKGLIRSVVENATVPVVETAAGNCHVYVDADADIDMAVKIVLNAKVQRPSVCNAAETLLIDKKIADKFIPVMFKALKEKNVEIRADQNSKAIFADVNDATDEDYYTEYNDYIMAVKVVDGIDEAIEHINKYNTKHSEAIVTNNYEHSQKFLNEVDAAAVYVNASTRFTDGFEFGFGAEIGISTQKLHARGPVDESKAWEKRVSDTVKGSNISVSEFYKLMDDCALKNLIPYDDAVIISGLNRAEWHSELEKPYEYSENVLSQLYGKYKIGVIANQPLGTQKRLEKYGLAKYISLVISSAEEGVSKPDIRLFQKALEKADCKGENAVMVGDRVDNDVAPAKKLGMKTVCVKQGIHKLNTPKNEFEVPDYTVDTIEELLNILKEGH